MDFISAEKNPFSEKLRRGTNGETVKTSTSNVNGMPPGGKKQSYCEAEVPDDITTSVS